MSASEITVVVKDDEKRLTKKQLVYETYSTDENDPFIAACVAETVKEFASEPTDVTVKITMVIR